MQRRFLFFLFFIAVGCNKFESSSSSLAQDSIDVCFEKANDDAIEDSTRRKTIEKVSGLIKQSKIDSLNLVNRIKLSVLYLNNLEYDKQKNELNEIRIIAAEVNDSLNLARAYTYLGDYYNRQSKSDSAYNSFYQAEKIYLRMKDNMRAGYMHNKKANIQLQERDYMGAEKSAFVALNFLRYENNHELEFQSYNILGNTSLDLKEYQKAIDYYQKALDIINDKGISAILQPKALVLFNIGMVYQRQDKHEESINYFNDAINQPNLKEENRDLYTSIIGYRALSMLESNNLSSLPKDFYDVLEANKQWKDTLGIVNSQIHLSEFYSFVKNKDSAIFYAKAAYNNANASKILNLRLDAVDQLAKVTDVDFKKYSEISKQLRDSLNNAERKVSEKFARIEFETEEIKQEKERLAAQNKNILYVALIAFLSIVFVFVYRNQRHRNQRLLLLQQQQAANEEIYTLMLGQQQKMDQVVLNEKKRVSQELHDGILGRLFGARLTLDSLNNNHDEESVKNRLNYIEELKNLEQDIREISHDLNREKSAISNNFVAIVNNLIEEQKKMNEANLEFSIDATIHWDSIPNAVKINLYRILQESFTNCNKYAKATEIVVRLFQENNKLILKIKDDGVGFSTTKKAKGIGLKNISSRVTAINGTFEISSKLKKGTKILVEVPL